MRTQSIVRAVLLAVLLLTVVGVVWADTPASQPALMFVITGQSNAGEQGSAAQLTEGQRQPVEGAWYYAPQHTRQTRIVALQPYRGVFGVELSFARAIREATGREVVIVKNHSGGTSIIAWDPTAPSAAWKAELNRVGNSGKPAMYPKVLQLQQTAAAAYLEATGREVELAGVLYVQVERDSKVMYGALHYEENLKELIAALRYDWTAPRLPVIFIDSHSSLAGGGPIVHDAVVAVAADVPGTRWVPVRDLAKKDSVHFSTAGVWTLGERLAAAWLVERGQ